MTKLET